MAIVKQRRRLTPKESREMSGNWYSQPLPPESTWPKCSACGTRARILDEMNKECIRCRVERMKKTRLAGRVGGVGN